MAERVLIKFKVVKVGINFELGCMNLEIQTYFFFITMRNTISEAADFNEGTACSTVHMYTSQVVYIRNLNMGESR